MQARQKTSFNRKPGSRFRLRFAVLKPLTVPLGLGALGLGKSLILDSSPSDFVATILDFVAIILDSSPSGALGGRLACRRVMGACIHIYIYIYT